MPFPGAQYALYNATDYVWNPPGTGQSREYFGIPIFMLTDQLAEQTLWRATYNAEHQLKVCSLGYGVVRIGVCQQQLA